MFVPIVESPFWIKKNGAHCCFHKRLPLTASEQTTGFESSSMEVMPISFLMKHFIVEFFGGNRTMRVTGFRNKLFVHYSQWICYLCTISSEFKKKIDTREPFC